MPRNGSGVYSLPAIYDVDVGETITPGQVETPFEDIESDLNAARPIVAGGTGGTTQQAALNNLMPTSPTAGDRVEYDGSNWVKYAWKGAAVKLTGDKTGQNYASGPTTIAFDAEIEDEGGWHSTSTNTSRLTVPSGLNIKRVRIGGTLSVASVASSEYIIYQINRNGSYETGLPAASVTELGTALLHTFSSRAISVTPGDYFEVVVQIASDTSVTLDDSTCFWIEKV